MAEAATSEVAPGGPKWHVIGISGVTCGGKSSLCEALRASLPLPTTVINQDDYFREETHEAHVIIDELQHANWEILSSLDMERLVSDVRATVERKLEQDQVLIVEGILVMNHEPLARLMDLKFYLTLDQEECRRRRRLRVYDPPDPPTYFDLCVWPMHVQHVKQLTSQDITFLDGAEAQQTTLERVRACVVRTIKQREVKG